MKLTKVLAISSIVFSFGMVSTSHVLATNISTNTGVKKTKLEKLTNSMNLVLASRKLYIKNKDESFKNEVIKIIRENMHEDFIQYFTIKSKAELVLSDENQRIKAIKDIVKKCDKTVVKNVPLKNCYKASLKKYEENNKKSNVGTKKSLLDDKTLPYGVANSARTYMQKTGVSEKEALIYGKLICSRKVISIYILPVVTKSALNYMEQGKTEDEAVEKAILDYRTGKEATFFEMGIDVKKATLLVERIWTGEPEERVIAQALEELLPEEERKKIEEERERERQRNRLAYHKKELKIDKECREELRDKMKEAKSERAYHARNGDRRGILNCDEDISEIQEELEKCNCRIQEHLEVIVELSPLFVDSQVLTKN